MGEKKPKTQISTQISLKSVSSVIFLSCRQPSWQTTQRPSACVTSSSLCLVWYSSSHDLLFIQYGEFSATPVTS